MRALPLLLLFAGPAALAAAPAAQIKRPVPIAGPADGALGPAAVEAANPPRPSEPPRAPEPPTDMVDFLGRRSLCLDIVEDPGSSPKPLAARADYRRLRCAEIAREEAALRRARASDPAAMHWLDHDPHGFRLERIIVISHEWSTPPWLRRLDQSGTDVEGRNPFRLRIDLDAAAGRSTRIRIDRIGGPSRTLFLDNRHFPDLDLGSLEIWIDARRPEAALQISLSYGDYRGYCVAESTDPYDDRSSLSLGFAPDGTLTASRNDVVNCESGNEELDPFELSHAPGA
jgi:hypothetical protein